jgi:hypothetical protein
MVTVACAGKTEHILHGHLTYSIQFQKADETHQEGILEASFQIDTDDPALAAQFEINKSYELELGR